MHQRSPATDPGTDDLRTLLGREHALLAELFENVADACGSDAAWCTECFTELDQRLRAHMVLEEEALLPGLERVNAVEAHALAAEHDAIRTCLAELATQADRHALRAAPVRRLVELLRTHAQREDALAYRWADATLDARTSASLRMRVRERIGHLAQRARVRWAA